MSCPYDTAWSPDCPKGCGVVCREHDAIVADAPLNDRLVDEVLVDRVVADLKVDRALTVAEKAEAARRMFARGLGRASICARLGAAHRDVTTWLDGPNT